MLEDLVEVLKADADYRASQPQPTPQWPLMRSHEASDESAAISHKHFIPLKICLLLRLGEGGLAEKYWESWSSGQRLEDEPYRDPYLQMATEWTWALFDRAVCRHMRADDRMALASVESLAVIQPRVEAAAKARGFAERRTSSGKGVAPYLPFLEKVDALLTDQRRRSRADRTKVGAKKSDTIAKIAELEEIGARQGSQPGGVSLNLNPRVEALAKLGADVVAPLLDCLEHDRRLTRSVSFSRDFHYDRHILGVDEAAYEALCAIFETRTIGGNSAWYILREGDARSRQALVAELRIYWNNYQNESLINRWYRVLMDDRAGQEQWLEVGEKIVKRDGAINGQSLRMAGEALRSRQSPSVSELFAKRTPTMRAGFHAPDMALAFAKWDLSAAIPTLRAEITRCQRQHQFRKVGMLVTASVEAGDKNVLDEYAFWLRNQEPRQVLEWDLEALGPMWRYRKHLAVDSTARWMFRSAESKWHPLLMNEHLRSSYLDLIPSPLLGLAPFRKQVLLELTRKERCGTVEIQAHSGVQAKIDPGCVVGRSARKDDPLLPSVGTKLDIRVCDVCAWMLSAAQGMPGVELYWPLAERDRAIEACAAHLRRYGHLYTERERSEWRSNSFRESPRLVFPKLDQPATEADVESGNAIFSLASLGDARVVELPIRPSKARWKQQEGTVWQAEEIVIDGSPRRFFGFVGPHVVARVVAEEIELLPPNGSQSR